MTDFLTRLAALSHGEATAVKPRLPGRFAPLPEADLEEAGDRQWRPSPKVPGAGDDPPRALKQSPAPAARATDVPQPPSRLPDDRPGYRSFQQEARPEEEEQGRSGMAPSVTPLVSPVPDGISSGVAISAHGAADGEPTVPAGDRLQTSRVPDDGPATQSTRPAARPEVTDGAARSEGPPPIRPEAPLVPGGPGRPVGRERQPAMPAPESRPKSREAPSVHVTIGRVEVRAHAPPPPPAPRERRPAASSTLSLQDYLERDGSGGRRA